MATLQVDRQFALALAPFAEAMAAKPKYPAGDVANRRLGTKDFEAQMAAFTPDVPEVSRKDHQVVAGDGASILVAEFRNDSAQSSGTKTIYHIHGGGMILGSVQMFSRYCKALTAETGYRVFSVDYRLAPEHPHPTPVEDCWAGLQWLYENAATLGVDRSKVIVAGESAGGGLAAALVLLARDRELSPPLLKQVLTFPMLDDRTQTPNPAVPRQSLVWDYDDNITGWGALLGDKFGTDAVSQYAAPARAKTLAGLPPTYMEIGQLDIFAPENLEYVSRLLRANVQVEFHLWPGLPHGFMMFAPNIPASKASRANLIQAFLEA